MIRVARSCALLLVALVAATAIARGFTPVELGSRFVNLGGVLLEICATTTVDDRDGQPGNGLQGMGCDHCLACNVPTLPTVADAGMPAPRAFVELALWGAAFGAMPSPTRALAQARAPPFA
ncbi:MAG: hypothetical protein WCH83_10885 [Alphaproteobacteria bacterium]